MNQISILMLKQDCYIRPQKLLLDLLFPFFMLEKAWSCIKIKKLNVLFLFFYFDAKAKVCCIGRQKLL